MPATRRTIEPGLLALKPADAASPKIDAEPKAVPKPKLGRWGWWPLAISLGLPAALIGWFFVSAWQAHIENDRYDRAAYNKILDEYRGLAAERGEPVVQVAGKEIIRLLEDKTVGYRQASLNATKAADFVRGTELANEELRQKLKAGTR